MLKTTHRMLKERPLRVYLDTVRRQGKHYAFIDSIPPEVLVIFVAREDRNFYRHKGVQPRAIFHAFLYSIRKHVPMPGASTITQQLLKNLYFSCDRSVLRKVREIALALKVEYGSMLTKNEILELYLNCVRYGPDVYGLADAAEYYFGKTPDKLTRNQAVILSTIAISPYRRRPIERPVPFTYYRDESLYEMVIAKVMSSQEAKNLAQMNDPLTGFDPELRSMKDIYGLPEKKTPEGLVFYARAMVGSPYWKNGFGLTATLGLLNHSRWDSPNEFDGLDYLDDLGKRVFDDAGLIKGYLWSGSVDALPLHDRERDWTCAEIYENATEKGSMESFDHGKGRLLYATSPKGTINHVGVYSLDGLVYHAKDRAHGVVSEPFRPEDWAFWSDLPPYH